MIFVVYLNLLEDEEIELQDQVLPKHCRMKISTLRIAERYRGQRIGEGSIGLILWKWQKSKCDEIYVTVFEKHTDLISQLEHFGFRKIGVNLNGEIVYIKDKRVIDFSDPYKAFPFIKSVFDRTELERQYRSNSTVTIVEMLYYGYFGAGNNVNMDWLERNGCWPGQGIYPTDYRLSAQQFKKVLAEGKVDVQNVIID